MSRFLRFSIVVTALILIIACGIGANTPTPAANTITSPLTLAVTAQPNTYNAVNQSITYSYLVTNNGTTRLQGPVSITDNKIIVLSCPDVNTVGNNNGYLDVGESITCTGAYSITQTDINTGSVVNTSTASIGGQSTTPVNTTINVQLNPVLTMTKAASPTSYSGANQSITYTYVITNTGTATLGPTQFVVKDDRIPNPISCGANTTTLATNQTVTCTAVYTTTAADTSIAQIVNSATASGAGAGTIQPATATVTNTNVVPPGTTASNIPRGSTVQHDVIQGDWLLQISRCYGANYIAVRNANPQVIDPDLIYPATKITVPNVGSNGTIYGPPCVVFYTAVAGDTWDSIANKYNADVEILRAANKSITNPSAGVKIKVPINSKGGAPVAPITPIPTTPAPATLSLSVSPNPNTYSAAGQNINLNYTITNTGTSTLGPVQFTVRDSLFPNPVNCGTNATTLAPNQTVICNSVYITTQADTTAGQAVSNATATGAGASTTQPVVTTIRYTPIVPTSPTPRQPVRLTFPAGSPASVTQSGTLGTPDTIRYVFAGTAGQILSVRLTVPSNDINMAIYGPNNATLKAPDAVNTWSGTLTTTGDHFIDLTSSVGAASKTYTLDVTLTTPAPSSPTERVADVNPGSGDSNPSYLAPFNGQLYFQANANDGAGRELWKYDRGLNAVSRVADISPGGNGSEPAFLTPYKDMLYFKANGGDGAGAELWRYNGSATGRVTDINSGPGDANPMYMTVFNDILYFSANGNDGMGNELWKYDGTIPSRVADINPGSGDSNPAYLAVFNNVLYFSATSNDSAGTELWKYDGATSPSRVADINSGIGSSSPSFLTVFNNALYFGANGNDGAGNELWKYDGTNPPARAADINPGAGDSVPTYMTVFNNALYFSANGDSTGFELWKFDGTTPSRAADINPAADSKPSYLAVYNNELYFSALGNDGAGVELWKFKGP